LVNRFRDFNAQKGTGMDFFSIPQMAANLGISDNTVRRYMKRFKDCLPSPVKEGIVYKYPEPTTELIKKIYAAYEKGMSKTEIINNLQSGNDNTSSTLQQPDQVDILGGQVETLTSAIIDLTTSLENKDLKASPKSEVKSPTDNDGSKRYLINLIWEFKNHFTEEIA
jgi:transcriptional antiterminator